MINIDKSGANLAGLYVLNAGIHDSLPPIVIRQYKYLNNIVEQDYRFIERRTRPMMGFIKRFESAQTVLGGIELSHILRKGQLAPNGLGASKTVAEQFYPLAA